MKLVIAEKPSVAGDIAKVIGAGVKKEGYIEGNGYIVTWCVGHLIELKTPEEYDPDLKKWELKTLPFIPKQYGYKVVASARKQFNIVKSLMADSRVVSIVCATDAGREGELIFRLVYMAAGCKKPFERLWISSMTDKAIKDGFNNLKPGSAYDDLYKAALARANSDFVLGINGTRLYTIVYNRLLKVGRVKSPTITMIVNREQEIRNFKKEKYYLLHLFCKELGINARSEQIKEKSEAEEKLKSLQENVTLAKIIKVTEQEKNLKPPRLYNLSNLQIDANKLFGYSGNETLDTLQALYEKHKLVTYPRTDAEYLTEDMEEEVKRVAEIVVNKPEYIIDEVKEADFKQLLNSKKVSDHHALLPTENVSKFDLSALSEKERNILNLIIIRLLCAIGSPQKYTTTRVDIKAGDTMFTDTAKVVTYKGWKEAEEKLISLLEVNVKENADKDKEFSAPLQEGDEIPFPVFKISEHETQPPSRYTEGSLIKAMDKAGAKDLDKEAERQGLGTSATRAGIIAEIKKDGLITVEGKNLVPSLDAFKLVSVLPDELKSVDMTVDWENKLVKISKGEYSYDLFMGEIINFVKYMTDNYRTAKSGVVFADSGNTGLMNTKYLGECPNCGDKILQGKYGAYCNGKCGIMLNKAYGRVLTDVQIKSILAGKKTLLKGLTSNKGSTYDMYVKMTGVKDYSYADKDGNRHNGKVLDYETSFPDRK